MIRRENIEAIYPLMEKQRALAYFSLQPSLPDPGFIQMRFMIQGPLDQAVFAQSWQELLCRHESLRTSLQSPKNKPSMLVVVKNCQLEVEWVDLIDKSQAEHKRYIDTRLEQISDQGFNLSEAPVHRLLGVRTSDTVVEFYWACHHLFLDGWSAVVLLNDLAQLYSKKRAGVEPNASAVSTHADYLRWRSERSADAAAQFWSERLAGYDNPALFASQFSRAQGSNAEPLTDHHELVFHSGPEFGAAIDKLAAELKVTSATILYTVWAIYLSVVADADDVVFGTTTAGRSFDLPDNQIMTGYFANVIPRRYQLIESDLLVDVVADAQKNNFSALPYEYLSIDEIQSSAGIAINKALFDNLILFENLPQSDIVMQDPNGDVSIGTFSGGLTSTYPLTLTIRPDTHWRFKFLYSHRLNDKNLHNVLELFPSFLMSACNEPHETIASHVERLRAQMDPYLVRRAPLVEVGFDRESKIQLARNSTELAVSAIWQKILGIDEIDVYTEFIALGGRSIAAVRMLAKIEDTLGKKLTMLEFVRQPTVAALAQIIDGDAAESHWRCLIPLKSTGTRPPVIFVHAVGTHVLFMRSITPYFHEDQPVLGLQPIGLDGECEPLQSIESIAALYLEEIKTFQPTGPYHFVSHCIGSVVAHEMITQLKQRGEKVGLFVVLDAGPPLLKKQASSGKRFTALVRDAVDSSGSASYADVGARILKHSVYRIRKISDKFRQPYSMRFGSTLARNRVHMEFVHKAVQNGYFAYRAKPIDQKIIFISSMAGPKPRHMGWNELTSEFEVMPLSIGHLTMFTEPEVGILGKQLNRLMVDASVPTVQVTSRTEPSL